MKRAKELNVKITNGKSSKVTKLEERLRKNATSKHQ